MLFVDTHVLVWLDEGSPRLGTEALQVINRALASGQLGVASISFWEIAMLVRKRRLDIRIELDVWRLELLQNGLLEIPFQGSTALRAGQLQDFHGDSADRMIVATALEHSATLVAAEQKILDWGNRHHKIDASL
jgi:PIN domain nuclease of toxin-antitoxin system